MLHFCGRAGRVLLVSPLRFAVRRPLLAGLAAAFLILAGAGLAGWWYSIDQWRHAQVAVKEERYEEAGQRIEYCLRLWPNSTEVHRLAARISRRRGDIRTAETHLNRCLELERGATDDVQLEFLLLRIQTGEVDGLAPLVMDLVENGHPESREILDTVAGAYSLRLRYKPAYACLTKWIEVEPQNAKPYYWRGWVLERLNQEKSASLDYHRAIEIDPDMVPARLRIAEMLLEDKQAPEARPHLDRLARQVPDDPQVKARMGICLFLQGNAADSRSLLEAAAVHLPKDPALLVTLANLELQEGNGAAAESWVRKVLAFDSSDTEALFVLASALQLQGRVGEADAARVEYETKRDVVNRINELLKDKADSPNATPADYAEIGSLFVLIRRDRYAVYWLEKALDIDPNYQPAHRALAEFYEQKGDARAAVHRRQVRGPALGGSVSPATGSRTSDQKQP